jgi:oligopeptide transport system substrate-binding protein
LAASALSGCARKQEGSAGRAPCPKGQVCLEYGNSQEIGTLDPQKTNGDWENDVASATMLGLIDTDAASKPIPGMATHWETTPDGLTWTFHLREAEWSDGHPVTADDFVYGWRRAFDPKTASEQAQQFYAIKNAREVNGGKLPLTALGVSAPDKRTFVVKLEHPWPILPSFISTAPIMSPIPKWVVDRWGDQWVQPAHFVGNGPFLPVSWKLGDRVTLKKNPRFYDAKNVCLDRVSFYPTVDPVSAERRVKAGELDLNREIASNRVAFLRQAGQMPDYVHVTPYVGIIYLAFNMRDVPAFKDVRVRQALAMAIDRDFITKKLLRAGATPAKAFLPPGLVDYDGREKIAWADWPFEKRQAEARRLLAEAGYGPGHPLKVEIKHRNSAEPSLYIPAVQADWRSIGVEAQLAPNESKIAYQSYLAKDFQIADAGWVGGDDALGFMFLLRSNSGDQNYSGYHDPQVEELLNKADNEPDLERRMEFIAAAERRVLDAMPLAPIYNPVTRRLVNPMVTGWVDNFVDNHNLRYVCFKDAARRRAE